MSICKWLLVLKFSVTKTTKCLLGVFPAKLANFDVIELVHWIAKSFMQIVISSRNIHEIIKNLINFDGILVNLQYWTSDNTCRWKVMLSFYIQTWWYETFFQYKFFLNAKCSLSLWSKLAFGHREWFLDTNLFLIETFLITKLTVHTSWLLIFEIFFGRHVF